jgi:hypothetical protein
MKTLILPLLFGLACRGEDLLPPDADQRLARDIFQQMIESKSGLTTGSTTPIAEAVNGELRISRYALFLRQAEGR